MYRENALSPSRRTRVDRSNVFGKQMFIDAKLNAQVDHAGLARCMRLFRRGQLTELKLPALQKLAGLKRRGFYKAFTRHLGCGPGSLLRAMKLKRASELLLCSELSVSEVAYLCGYRSENSLWVAFKRDFGVSPVQYREKQLNKKASRAVEYVRP